MKKLKTLIYSGLFLLLPISLTSCGSSGDGGGGAATTTKAVVAAGVMSKGSVIVNGVRFEDTAANITIDDQPKVAADLEDGMVVHVRGRINDDGITGVAERVDAEDELEGPITSIDIAAGTLVVFNHTVFIDDLTVFANIPVGNLTGIHVGDIVEVHGFVDANGRIRATRLEEKTLAEREDEIKGFVTNKTATTFNIDSLVVTFDNNTVIVGGTTFTNGDFVEVHLDAALKATRIELEDVEDAEFEPGENEEVEVEGFVSEFTSHPGVFKVNGHPVQTTSNTEFERGSSLDLGENVRVEAEGNLVGGVIIAEKIQFKRTRILIQAIATAKNIPGGELTLLGKIVHVDALTRFDDSFDSIVVNVDRVEIRGFVDKFNKIIVERLKKAGGNNDDILQAPVELENVAGQNITLLGITANVSGAQFQNDNDVSINANDFFTAVVAAPDGTGTLVKVKGTFNAGTGAITVREAELED